MVDYNDIKQSIATNLPDNNNKEITAARLRDTLNGFVDKVQETETEIDNEISELNFKIGDFTTDVINPTITLVDDYYVKGRDGSIIQYEGSKYMECGLDGTKKYIRFSGSNKSSGGDIGYSFYDSNDMPIGYSLYKVGEPIELLNYTIEIPDGAVKFRATLVDEVFNTTPYYIYLFNQNINTILTEHGADIDKNTNSIDEIINSKITTHTFTGKYINSNGDVSDLSYYNIYTLKVNKNDSVKVKLSCSRRYASIAFGSTNNATSGLTVIQNGSNEDNNQSILTYFCRAIDDGYLYFVSNVAPEYMIVRNETYENDDAYYQDKFKNQITIYPEIGAISVYATGSALNFNFTTRIIFKVFLEANKTSKFTLTNPNSISLVINNFATWVNGNHTEYSTWSTSLSNGILSITNPTSENGYAIIALKKTDDSEFTNSDIVGLKLTRDFGSSAIVDGNDEFVATMNRYASRLGMTNSNFVNSYGGLRGGANSSCVADILKMAINSWDYEKIRHFMSVRSVDVSVYGANARTATITNSTQATMDSYYTEMKNAGQIPDDLPSTNPFILLGAKGGGWSSGEHKAFSLVAFTVIDGKLVCGVSATNADSYDGTTGRVARVKGMLELFCIATKLIKDEDITGMDTTFVEKSIVAIVPNNCGCYTNINITPLWSKNPTDVYNPASTTKILAGMVVLDTIPNLHEYHQITSDEVENDSAYTAYAGDVETVETSLYAMFLASNGTNTISLAKMAGNKMVESKNKFV